MALRAVEMSVSTAHPSDVRRVASLERRHQFGQELASTNNRILDLILFDASLLGVGVALLLHDLINLRCQGSRIPYYQFALTCCVSTAYQPPRCRCRQGRGCPSPS